MAKCRTKRFARTSICVADLRHRVTIEQRELQTPGPEDETPTMGFTVIGGKPVHAGIETPSYPTKFNGTNTLAETTHVIYIRRNSAFENVVEGGNYFVRLKGRLLRILRFGVLEEDDRYFIINATERGVDTQQSNKA